MVRLVKTGSGTLTLNGEGDFSALTVEDGTLAFASDSLGNQGSIVMNGGTLRWEGVNTEDLSGRIEPIAAGVQAAFDVGDNHVEFTSGLSGQGGLAKLGDGTLEFSAANAYTGGTVLGAGTLLYASGTLPANGLISFEGGALKWGADNADDVSSRFAPIGSGQAAILDSNGNDITLADEISGDGGLRKLGSGTLILTGENSYSGDTTISGGVLQVGNGGTTGLLGLGAIENDAALVFDRSDTIAVENVISGSGDLFQQGSGRLELWGANSFTGQTRIVDGTLSLENYLALKFSTLDLAASDEGELSFFCSPFDPTGRIEWIT